MPGERVDAFLARSNERVLNHCDALLALPLPEEQRSRLVTLRAVAEADLASWLGSNPCEQQRSFGNTSRILESVT